MIAFWWRILAQNDMFCGIRNKVLDSILKFWFHVFLGRGEVQFPSQNFEFMIQKFVFRLIFCRISPTFGIKNGLTTS